MPVVEVFVGAETSTVGLGVIAGCVKPLLGGRMPVVEVFVGAETFTVGLGVIAGCVEPMLGREVSIAFCISSTLALLGRLSLTLIA